MCMYKCTVNSLWFSFGRPKFYWTAIAFSFCIFLFLIGVTFTRYWENETDRDKRFLRCHFLKSGVVVKCNLYRSLNVEKCSYSFSMEWFEFNSLFFIEMKRQLFHASFVSIFNIRLTLIHECYIWLWNEDFQIEQVGKIQNCKICWLGGGKA